jgi:hypothetical protein
MRTRTSAGIASLLFLFVLFLFGLAAPSAADLVPFRNGRLTLRIEALETVSLLEAPAGAPATGTVDLTRTATTLSSLAIVAGALSVEGASVALSDPALDPIVELTGSFANEAATFSGSGSAFGGSMGLRHPANPAEPGVVGFCLFFPCDDPNQPDLEIPLGVVGIGGQDVVDDGVVVTITGAPWTIGSAVVPLEGGAESVQSGSLTLLGDGYLRVRLVTPVSIEIDAPGFPDIPSRLAAFGLLDLEVAPVPEPGPLAAGLAALGALAGVGATRGRSRADG